MFNDRIIDGLKMAGDLGEKDIIVLFTKPTNSTGNFKRGLLVKNTKEAQKAKSKYDIIVALATRENIECKSIDMVYGSELEEGKDKLHHRRGLNQVLAKLIATTGKTYIFSLDVLKKNPPLMLGRMQQNKKILDKYKAKTQCCSFANEALELRSPRERKLFLELL